MDRAELASLLDNIGFRYRTHDLDLVLAAMPNGTADEYIELFNAIKTAEDQSLNNPGVPNAVPRRERIAAALRERGMEVPTGPVGDAAEETEDLPTVSESVADELGLSGNALTVEDAEAEAGRQIPGIASPRLLEALADRSPFAAASGTARQAAYDRIEAQIMREGGTPDPDRINAEVDILLGTQSWVPLDDRAEFQEFAIPTIQQVQDALGSEEGRRQVASLFQEANQRGLGRRFDGKYGMPVAQRYRQMLGAVNRDTRRTKEQTIEELRQASAMLTSLSDPADHRDALLGMGISPDRLDTSQPGNIYDEIEGYQQNEWMLDTSAVDTYGGLSRNQDIYNDQAFMEALPFNNVTLLEAKAMFTSLPNDELASLQMLLFEMGYYDAAEMGPPQLGVMRPGEADLWAKFINQIQANPGKRVGELVRDNVRTHYDNVARVASNDLDGALDKNGDGVPDNIFSITSRETLGMTVDDAVQRLTGREVVDPKFRDELIDRAQSREKAYLLAMNGSFVANRLNGGVTSVDDVDIFLEAIGAKESGGDYNAVNRTGSGATGKYQFMPSTWRMWAERSGLGAGAAMTPENQEYVARAMASYYYKSYGNWYDAAIAWYMGPGKVGDHRAQVAGQGAYPSGRGYAQGVLQEMRNVQQRRVQGWSQGGGFGVQTDEDGNLFVEEFDKDAYLDQLARAGDEVGHQTWSYNDRGRDFISMLGSTIR